MKYIPLNSNDKMLKTATEIFNFNSPPINVGILCANMRETLEDSKLSASEQAAIAAIQVGMPFRMFIMKDGKNFKFYFNPRIVDVGPDKVNVTEGDINHIGLNVKVSRPYAIKVRYQDETGNTTTEMISNVQARLYQMMLRSLDGVKFYEDANYLNKAKAIKDWRIISRRTKEYT